MASVALAIKNGQHLSLTSRNEKDLTRKYQEVTEALRGLDCRAAVLDGEIVAVDRHGKSSFQLLQIHNQPGHEESPLLYYAFDLLNLNGRDLKSPRVGNAKRDAQKTAGSRCRKRSCFRLASPPIPKRLLRP